MGQSENIYHKVTAFIKEQNMLRPGIYIAAGVSGGSDSVVMLHILNRFARKYGCLLQVIHINHKIRGKEAERDAAFVRDMCSDLGLPFLLYEYDVPRMSRENHLSMEEAGREARTEAFRDAILKSGIEKERCRIALAHNKNDLAETVVHNLARGTGIRGLCSMKPKDGERIRPLLCLEKEEILLYAGEKGLSFVTDSTNLTDEYTRNRIRRFVIPALTDINEKAVAHIAETSVLAQDAADYMERQAERTLRQCPKDGNSIFLGEAYSAEDPAVRPYVILKALEELTGHRKDFTSRHIKDIMGLWDGNKGRRAVLPEEVRAVREAGGIRLTAGEAKKTDAYMESRIFDYYGQPIPQNNCVRWFDCDKITEKVEYRVRRNGDYMVIHPDGRKKKLTRIMMDDSIPAESRSQLLLAAAGSHVLWIAGGRNTEGFRVSADTKRVLEIKYYEGDRHERKNQGFNTGREN